jgi:hypothetical protein
MQAPAGSGTLVVRQNFATRFALLLLRATGRHLQTQRFTCQALESMHALWQVLLEG